MNSLSYSLPGQDPRTSLDVMDQALNATRNPETNGFIDVDKVHASHGSSIDLMLSSPTYPSVLYSSTPSAVFKRLGAPLPKVKR
ncbi:unnamed protein product [Protopolystoma xenopodis]|uniref:Uncharacterized protein n=1 Tax=Protopolystoma xenopodis TaxID=117903 RepID=A0A448X3S0_9PLAT|nr:unnamed protein product [Protopolystoma xenopodis]